MKIAIHLFGHLRTYKKTYDSFKKNIILPNENSGFKIDIFLHTWDELNTTEGIGRSKRQANLNLNHVQLKKKDILELIDMYQPKRYLIQKKDIFHGRDASIKRVFNLRREYEQLEKVFYNFHMFLRYDLLFATPFVLKDFLNIYNSGEMLTMTQGLPEKFCFIASNIFRRSKIADFRYFHETDLFWISNYGCNWDVWVDNKFNFNNNFPVTPIAINYKLNTDFYLWRDISDYNLDIDPLIEIKKSLLINKDIENTKLTNENTKLTNENTKLIEQLKSYDIKRKEMKILNLEQSLINKKLKTKILEKKITKPVPIIQKISILYIKSAKQRIQNQLSYKLGQAMIINSKSLLGYIKMPFVLSYIKDKHNQEQKIYEAKIKKDPSLKLPPLESYPDYKEALKEKECLTYKLGQVLIKANKTWYKGGYVKLWFEIKRLKMEFERKKDLL